ncbi:MAG: hypothetical protein U1E76_22060 [Planctomycetota bacterium]
MQRTGLIVRMAELYLIGPRPHERAARFSRNCRCCGSAFGFSFEVLRDVSFLVREASIPLVGAARGVSARRVPRFGAAVDALWERAKATITTPRSATPRTSTGAMPITPTSNTWLLEVSDDRRRAVRHRRRCSRGGRDDSIVSILECLVPARDRDDADGC